jgi:hypothetical protein
LRGARIDSMQPCCRNLIANICTYFQFSSPRSVGLNHSCHCGALGQGFGLGECRLAEPSKPQRQQRYCMRATKCRTCRHRHTDAQMHTVAVMRLLPASPATEPGRQPLPVTICATASRQQHSKNGYRRTAGGITQSSGTLLAFLLYAGPSRSQAWFRKPYS